MRRILVSWMLILVSLGGFPALPWLGTNSAVTTVLAIESVSLADNRQDNTELLRADGKWDDPSAAPLIGATADPTANTCFTEVNNFGAVHFASADAQALRVALVAVAPGGTIKVAGICSGATLEDGTVQVARVTKYVHIRGGYTVTNWSNSFPVTQPTTLDAMSAGRVLYYSPTISADLSGLVLQNGAIDGEGGAIHASGSLALTETQIISNTAGGSGGGIFVYEGAVTLYRSLFQNNRSDFGGGGIAVHGTLALSDTQLISNSAKGAGGGYVLGATTLDGGLFLNNRATEWGMGGLYVSGPLSLIRSEFISNTAMEDGGGVYANHVTAIFNTLFRGNQAGISGGGLYARHIVTLTDSAFIGNIASTGAGGGAYLIGKLTLNGSLFQDNKAYSGGGGIYSSDTLEMTGTRFLSNAAKYLGGGGVWTYGAATLHGGLFEGNWTTENAGGLFANSTIAITGTQFSNNRAANGGGVFHNSGTGRMVNALFAGNASSTTIGNALYLNGPGDVLLIHATIASPTQATGSAIYGRSGIVQIVNTIIASHTVGISQAGGIASENFNLFAGVDVPLSGAVGVGMDSFTGATAFADPVAINYRLTSGSAAIDVGIDGGITSDYEGQSRPFGVGFDIGFDEWIGEFKTYVPVVLQ